MLVQPSIADIQKRARSYIRGNFIDYKGYNSYLNSLIGTKELAVIDISTGEMLLDAIAQIPDVKIANEAFYGKIEELKGKGPDKILGHHFNIVREMNWNNKRNLTNHERKYLLLLAKEQFKDYNSITFEQNGYYFSTAELCDIWEVKIDRCNRIKSSLIKKGFMIKKSFGRNAWKYALSQNYAYIGKDKTGDEFVKVMSQKFNTVIEKVKKVEETKKKRKQRNQSEETKQVVTNKRPKQETSAIGTLEAIIPYFHKQLYFLSTNPTENVIRPGETTKEAYIREAKADSRRRKIKFMSKRKLSEIVSNKTSVRSEIIDEHLDTLEKAGALKVSISSGTTRIRIHPFLLSSISYIDAKDEYTEFVLAEFGIHID